MHLIKYQNKKIEIIYNYATQAQIQQLLKYLLPRVAKLKNTTPVNLQAEWCKYFGQVCITELTKEQASLMIHRCKQILGDLPPDLK
jgi:hypothetical protein